MTTEQNDKDLIDKLGDLFINKNKEIAYSIRKCGEDEIEIRDSTYDGYVRGLLRFIVVGMAFIGIFDTGTPFYREYENANQNYEWAFNADKFLQPMYEDHVKFMTNPEKIEKYKLEPYKETYEEFKTSYIDEYHKFDLLYFCGYCVWGIFLSFAFFLPRPRGFRVNRKKRVIYWQTILGSHAVAFVPETGDPLGGINYCRFGLYAFGEHKRFSLQLWINDFLSKRRVTALFGVYPSPSSEHNAQILQAIRAYLTEENPEFLRYIGRDYKNFGVKLHIAFCNAFALRVPFSRKKADAAIEKTLAEWHKKRKTPNQKQGWFNDLRASQKIINERTLREGLNNEVPWEGEP